MDDPVAPDARIAPATSRNREPILAVLRSALPKAGLVFEIAAGSGEHARFFAAALPRLRWLPSDPDPEARASIAAWRAHGGTPNLSPPAAADAQDPASWPVTQADAVVCINMVHISPWAAALGLMAGSGRILARGGVLFLYGPFLEDGQETAPSNRAFDLDLRTRDAEWGLRELAEVDAAARRERLDQVARVAMPANNLSLVYRKT